MKTLSTTTVTLAALLALAGCSGGDGEDATPTPEAPDAPPYEVVDVTESDLGTDLTVETDTLEDLDAVFEAVRSEYDDEGGYYVVIDCTGRPEGVGPGRLGTGRYAVGDTGASITGLADGEAVFEPIEGAVCPLP